MPSRIPQSFIDDLMARTDLVQIIHERVPLKKAGRDFSACCPFHDEKTPSFTVSPGKQFYHCFGCGAHGNAVGFLMEYDRLSFPEAIQVLAEQFGLQIPVEARGALAPRKSGDEELYALLEAADRFYRQQLRQHPENARAVDYLRGRGLSGDVAARYGIGYAPPGWDNLISALGRKGYGPEGLSRAGLTAGEEKGRRYDRFRDRVMFPIRDHRGRVIGFGGRVLGDDTPKYLNSPETPLFHKGRSLYGLYELGSRRRPPEKVLVVEGYMDVVALAQFGVDYAVATLGTATTREHLERLFRLSNHVVFCFDGDRAGREAAWRALQNSLPLLRDGRHLDFLFLPEGEDPDSMVRSEGKEDFEARLGGAQPLSEVLMERLTAGLDMATADGRAAMIAKARPLFGAMPGGAFAETLLGALADRSHLPMGRLERLLTARGATPSPAKRESGTALVRTPIRRAMALILHQPSLAQALDSPEDLRDSTTPGLSLLLDLIEVAQGNPHISSGGLLEHFRESPHFEALARLATWRPALEDELLPGELTGALQRIREKESAGARLLNRIASGEPLTDEEFRLYRQLHPNSAPPRQD